MRLTAMLVDDEPMILQNLETVVPWATLDIDIVASARNGRHALELAHQVRPDLILSDIRMPKMDGIEFLQQLREQGINSEVIMLTGYGDFEYARSVMRHGARDYLLKPIDYDELRRVVIQAADSIRQRKSLDIEERRTKSAAFHLACEKLLTESLLGTSYPSVRTLLEADGVNMKSMKYTFMLADLDVFSQASPPMGRAERKVWNFAVRNVMEDMLRERLGASVLLQLREGEYCVLLEQREHDSHQPSSDHSHVEAKLTLKEGPDPAKALQEEAAEIQQAVWTYTKKAVSIAYHPIVVGIEDLAGTYQNLQLTLRLLPERQRTLIAADAINMKDSLNVTIWQDIEQVVGALKRMKRDELENTWSGLVESMRELAARSQAKAERFLSYLNLHIIRELEDMKLLDEEEKQTLWMRMESERTLPELLEDIRGLLSRCLETSLKRKPGDVLMLQAKEYIERHIAKDLAIDEIAESLGISASYFSLLFKQHFGETFVEHVTRQRMELAQSLLAYSEHSIAAIGKQVGYQERRYFTKVFQKHFGVTPSEYREARQSLA